VPYRLQEKQGEIRQCDTSVVEADKTNLHLQMLTAGPAGQPFYPARGSG
jgi:hypothetical protein